MIRIGKIVATHGLNGSLVMTHVLGASNWLKKEHVLHVEMQKGSFIPYFVSALKAANDEEYILNLEEVDKIDAAKKLVTKHVYVDEAILSGFARQSPLLWIGFAVVDKHKGPIGSLSDVVQAGPQWLGKLLIQGKEVLIPLIEETIKELDIKNKKLKVDLPEGLLEIYLG